MSVFDQRVTLAPLYAAKREKPKLVDVPALTVIALEGTGDPATSSLFQASVEALSTVAWGIRARRKAQDPSEVIKVMPLEGQWSLPPGTAFFEDPAIRDQLQWSIQIVQPGDMGESELELVKETAVAKKPERARVSKVELRRLPGGSAAQILHVGPFSEEPASIARIHEHIATEGGTPVLGHREIYLSDFRRTAPEKLRTILRVNVTR